MSAFVRPPVLRLALDELVVDNFAGGGGASTGIEWATGRSPDLAINHDAEALAMHAANHPTTRHLRESVWDVDPVEVCGGRPVGLAWFSPDCTFHSKARGAKPFRERSKALRRRGLAWVVTRWAAAVRPRVICLENVEEFQEWGPLDNDGKPDPAKAGRTFRAWVARLKRLGYEVQWRELRACDFGAPTIRKRLFVVARCDGMPIAWPTRTHGRPGSLAVRSGQEKAFRTAAECIDWAIPCPSIFERDRPLPEATLRRIARGIQRYVIDSDRPFIAPMAAHRGFAPVAPTLVQTGYGEREGQAPRALDIEAPLGTIVGTTKHALVSAFLAKHFGGVVGQDLGVPTGTVTARDHHSLVTAELAPDRRDHADEVRALLVKFYGNEKDGQPLDRPIGTVTTKDRFGLVMVAGLPYRIVDIGMRMLQPRELFRAQGFSDSYVIDPLHEGRPLTKTAQVRMCGNSVSPDAAAALVAANLSPARAEAEAA